MAKKILIVDDEADIRKTLRTILETSGYEVFSATTADQCLEKLKEIKPDLILMDIMMPGMQVSEAIKLIKKTKIYFVSVIRTSDDERQDLKKQKNVLGFIEKPFDVDTLLEKVNGALR